MTTSDLVRWGGLSGVLAGVMYALTAVLSLLAPQERVLDSFSDYLIEVIFVLGLAGTLVAVVGLHALHSGRYGLFGSGRLLDWPSSATRYCWWLLLLPRCSDARHSTLCSRWASWRYSSARYSLEL